VLEIIAGLGTLALLLIAFQALVLIAYTAAEATP
jgi:hypothetical protein